ncbi:hypothetical protein AYI68_g2223 [Smittium mucronatum]|uniref:Uncharacterized protein n=1 Tax=Smittium mucronatum TaxID=133383 RepID=A0A1R0H3B8_9FUNG|nr:hypothetical protein AYI68_g2223 [Smittium mucronatum]
MHFSISPVVIKLSECTANKEFIIGDNLTAVLGPENHDIFTKQDIISSIIGYSANLVNGYKILYSQKLHKKWVQKSHYLNVPLPLTKHRSPVKINNDKNLTRTIMVTHNHSHSQNQSLP